MSLDNCVLKMCYTGANLVVAALSSAATLAFAQEPSASSSAASEDIFAAFPAAGIKVGVWEGDGLVVATGFSTSIADCGERKNKRIERKFALVDAKERILKKMAKAKVRDYDPAIHDVKGTFGELEIVRSDSRSNGEEWVTISLPLNRLVVSVTFSVEKARRRGLKLFNSQEWGKSASVFARLTQEGVQDPKIVAMALAASAHVNLESGVKGEMRTKALEHLGEFYITRNQPEESLKYYFQIYTESTIADKELLQRLASLCKITHRLDDSRLFLEELNTR